MILGKIGKTNLLSELIICINREYFNKEIYFGQAELS